jgi:gas vesicle protein
MGVIQSSVGGVIGAAIGAVGAAKVKDIADSKKETEAPKTDMGKIKKEAEQNRITMNKVIDKAAEANRISMMHVEARKSQSQAFAERLEAVRTGNWKASRTKLKRRGK